MFVHIIRVSDAALDGPVRASGHSSLSILGPTEVTFNTSALAAPVFLTQLWPFMKVHHFHAFPREPEGRAKPVLVAQSREPLVPHRHSADV